MERLASDQTIEQGFGHRFGSRVHLQLFVDAAHVEVHRIDGDTQLGRGRLVVVAFDEELQQARLMWRQMVVGAFRRADVPERRAPSGDMGAPPGAASFRLSSSRAGGVFFSRYPHAPAHKASKMRSSSS